MARILVTGGAGFIGSHVVEALAARGDEVRILDDLNDFYSPARKRRNLEAAAGAGRVEFREGDIRDPVAVEAMVEGSETVLHLAAMAGVRPSIADPARYASVNVEGTARLLEASVRHGVRHFVFASSSSVYGNRGQVPFREADPVEEPISPYAATKRAGELLGWTFHHLHGLPVTCLRYFTVYGPRQRPEMAIHLFGRLMLEGRPVPLFGDGSMRRDFTFISDVVSGTLKALGRPSGYRVYNLGGARTTSLVLLIELLEQALGVRAALDRRPVPPGDVRETFADTSRAEAELGWRPLVPIEEGIARFARWLREESG